MDGGDMWEGLENVLGGQYMQGTPELYISNRLDGQTQTFTLNLNETRSSIVTFGECPVVTQSPTITPQPSESSSPSMVPSSSGAPTVSAAPTTTCIRDFDHLNDEILSADNPADPLVITIGNGPSDACPRTIKFDGTISASDKYFILECGAEKCTLDFNENRGFIFSNSFNITFENLILRNGDSRQSTETVS